jgi:hypothetical protein
MSSSFIKKFGDYQCFYTRIAGSYPGLIFGIKKDPPVMAGRMVQSICYNRFAAPVNIRGVRRTPRNARSNTYTGGGENDDKEAQENS